MPLDDDLAAWLSLSLTPGLSSDGMRRLLAAFGDPQRALSATRAALGRHVPDPVAAAIKSGGAGEGLTQVGAWLEEPGNHIVTLADAEYPRQLLQRPDPPPLLYVKGRVDCEPPGARDRG